MKPFRSKQPERLTPTEVVAQILVFTGQAIGRAKADDYVALAVELEAFMGERAGLLAWEELDVAQFVEATARGRAATIVRCCDLAAVLSWAWGIGGARAPEIAALYDTLERICPPDVSAHAYIRWGGERARGIEEEPPIEVLNWRSAGAA